jgi:dTDP-4-amino-4,6-dideoxygalactose transaminase
MGVPLFDLKEQYRQLEPEILPALQAFLPRQQLILGEAVEKFESALGAYCQVPHAVGVSSGTDALLMALEAAGAGPGDEVIVPAFTFYCTGSVVVRRGATPVFADVSLDDFNLLPEAVAAAVTPQTKVLMPVHLFGQACAIDALLDLAGKKNLVLIEDAAQAIGAEDSGRRAGSLGRFGAFSFFPTKNLGAFGDGGALTMRSSADYERVKMLRMHGSRQRYVHEEIGGCFRLDAVQALVLEIKLRHLESWHEARRRNAEYYRQHLHGVGDLILPQTGAGKRHVFNQFVIRTQKRDALRAFLQERGVGTEIYYPGTLPAQPAMQKAGYGGGQFPNAERLAKEVLALPIFPELTEAQLAEVVAGIRAFY